MCTLLYQYSDRSWDLHNAFYVIRQVVMRQHNINSSVAFSGGSHCTHDMRLSSVWQLTSSLIKRVSANHLAVRLRVGSYRVSTAVAFAASHGGCWHQAIRTLPDSADIAM